MSLLGILIVVSAVLISIATQLPMRGGASSQPRADHPADQRKES